MRLSSKIVALVAASLFAMQPLAACFADEMTRSEEECCQEMMGDCGQVTMPTSHACCRYVDGSAAARLEVRKTMAAEKDLSAVPVPSLDSAPVTPQVFVAVKATAESPPQPRSLSIQILRI